MLGLGWPDAIFLSVLIVIVGALAYKWLEDRPIRARSDAQKYLRLKVACADVRSVLNNEPLTLNCQEAAEFLSALDGVES